MEKVFSESLGGQLEGVAASRGKGAALRDEVARLFEEMRDGVYRYVMSLGLYPAQAQEVTQEAFLRLYASLSRGEPIENRRAWVVRVAHNHGLKMRAQQAWQAPFSPDVEVRLSDPDLNPEQSLLEKERTLRFHRAVENLSDQQRRCLHLRLEGLRYPEIAAVLGISASAGGEFRRRAIVRLRKVNHE